MSTQTQLQQPYFPPVHPDQVRYMSVEERRARFLVAKSRLMAEIEEKARRRAAIWDLDESFNELF